MNTIKVFTIAAITTKNVVSIYEEVYICTTPAHLPFSLLFRHSEAGQNEPKN